MNDLLVELSRKVWNRQTCPPEDSPHGWIQWKGTNVCMDVYCKCGAQHHIDGDFAYYVECGSCGAVFMVNGHVELVELTDEEVAAGVHRPSCIFMEDDEDEDDETGLPVIRMPEE